MKKLSFLALMAAAVMCLSSCVSSKKIIYFQGADSIYAQSQDILQKYEMRLKPADQVLVKVTCDNPELLEVFSSDVTMGAGGGGRGTSSYYSNSATGTMGSAYGFTVDNEGFVDLPALGKVQVANMTVDEAAKNIEKVIIARNLIKEPDVTVRLLNARVSVLGAVKSPRVVGLTSERNTILDVLANCSDVSDQALRQHVTLFRENNGKREMYKLDLTDANIFTSPAFYVQQNDLIYIEPNKSQNVKSSAFSTFLGIGGSIISALASVTALAISIVNLTK